MPNIETVRALINAFNVHNYFSNTVKTNFKLQSEGKKNYIVVSFDKSMDTYQCRRYLDSIKRKIIREFYGIEESNDAEILDTAKLIFDVNSFPFDINDRDWSWDKQHGFKFVTPVDKGVIFNLKSHLASSLKKDVLEGMPTCSIFTNAFDKKKYLWCGEFDNEELSQQFKSKFLSRMRERYKNVPKSPLKVEGNDVYIKDVFDDARFIDSVTRYKAWLTGMDLGVGNDVDHSVKSFKNMIIRSTYSVTKVMVDGFILAPPLNGRVVSILTPITQNGKGIKLLTKEEVRAINRAFNHAVLDDISGRTQAKLSVNGSSGIYGIDFSNPYISHCVITKIIKNSVINKDHELAIDPELCFRALSRSPSTELSDMKWESPTRSQGGVKDSPRQGSEKEEGEEGPRLLNYVNSVRTSDRPLTDLSYATTSCGVPGISRDLSAVQNVQAGPSGSSWTRSEPSSSKGAEADDESMPIEIRGEQVSYRSSSIPSPIAWNDSTFLNPEVSNKEPEKQQVTKEKEEEKLFKALLYWFNLNNYALDPPHTNFIAENGKIASLIDDSVDVKEYLQEIIDKTKEEYRVNKEEAYDFNEFPFQFLSNCEKNQETTVVANISCGALLNLKELFSREHEGKVEIKDIDINIVEKAVKSEKDEWVNSQVREHRLCPGAAITSCYPDESALEYISITKDEGGCWIDRTYDASEVESFRKEQWPAKGISKAEKMKSEDNKDSGISSAEATDAENVSSKAEATTSSGYESMDCENTREGSPKRTLELSVGMEELTISTDLYATKAEQHSPIKKLRSN
ncbi:hypothetical protein INQ25_03280 [Wolbachia endosymbiont of Rhagoletis cerasi]|uniref:hypothetical protein n=1 Tax=Wolbachia endosymbiont of Rhagoletis cerasi TaxID=225363 RepID=UPI001BD1C12F|nr:hypothetical protein [Wolbachia endosymbiont of Rhagoletis cerasi]MBS9530411.1 hypothetical protein [Wolbachia endosymbiont of Rhagoletis cerasi]